MIDLTGKRFGRWSVLQCVAGERFHGQLLWRCRCECGAVRKIPGGRLRRGESKSCGCLADEVRVTANTKHGAAAGGKLTPEYRAWSNMIDRCERPGNKQYEDWGGRGITVCARWRASFADFLVDMGPKPTPQHSLDRMKVDGNYTPLNCRWATRIEQSRNKRTNVVEPHEPAQIRWLRAEGYTAKEIAAFFGISSTVESYIATGKRWRADAA
jgi:hypothetical protein